MTDKATVVLDNGVQITHLGHVIVALGTKLGAGLDQKRAVLRGVGIVTVHTPAVRRRLVDHSRSRRVIVAAYTQVGRSFRQER
jgi:hypothetical protein